MKRGLEGGEAAPAAKRVKRDEDAAASSGPVASAAHLMAVDKVRTRLSCLVQISLQAFPPLSAACCYVRCAVGKPLLLWRVPPLTTDWYVQIEQYTEFHKELRLKQLNREYLKALEQAEMWEARQCDFLGGLRVIEAAWSQVRNGALLTS